MMPAAALFALQVLEALPTLIITGQNVLDLINNSTVAIRNMVAEKRDPTPAEWDTLNALIAAKRAQLHN